MSESHPHAHPGWAVRFPLAVLALSFLAGAWLGELGGDPRLPALACLGLSLVRPSPLAFAAGGLAGGVLACSFPRARGQTFLPAAPEAAWSGKVESLGRSAFGEEQALVRVRERGVGEPVRLTVRLTGPPSGSPTGSPSGPPYGQGGVPRPGESIRFRASLAPPRSGGEPWRGRLQGGGWVRLARTPGTWGWWEDWCERVREEVRRETTAMGEEGGVLVALALGECDGLSPRVLQEFRAAGTYHLLAVSGVHVAAAFLLAFLAVRPFAFPCSRSPRSRIFPAVAALAALAALAFYLGVVRSSSSALRAALFGGLMAAGALAGRERSLLSTAALSLLLIAAFSPAPRPDLSLALSLVGCLGIAASWREGDGWPLRLLRVSLGACLFTLPLVALAIRSIPLLAPLFNLAFGSVFDLLLIPLTVAADAAAGLAPAGARLLLTLARGIAIPLLFLQRAALPGWASLPLTLGGAVAAAVVAGAGAWLWWRRGADIRVGVVFLLAAPLAGAAGNLAAAAAEPGPCVVFAGAGQSDLALLRAGGNRVLIDAGPPASGMTTRAERFLAAEGVGKVDLLVLTHPHPDHIGGASALSASGRVGALVLPAGGGLAPWRDLLAQVRPGATVRFAETGESFPLGKDGCIEILSGGEGNGWDNRSSLVFLYRGAHGGTALFTGDAPWPAAFEAWRRSGPLTLLKVPHHGSAGKEFPGRIPPSLRASLAVICAIGDPSLPLPAPAVREAFFRACIPAACTGFRGGRVALTGDAAGVFR